MNYSYVYILVNTDNNEPFYVGTATHPKSRMCNHINSVKSKKNGSNNFAMMLVYHGEREDCITLEGLFVNMLKTSGMKIDNKNKASGSKFVKGEFEAVPLTLFSDYKGNFDKICWHGYIKMRLLSEFFCFVCLDWFHPDTLPTLDAMGTCSKCNSAEWYSREHRDNALIKGTRLSKKLSMIGLDKIEKARKKMIADIKSSAKKIKESRNERQGRPRRRQRH